MIGNIKNKWLRRTLLTLTLSVILPIMIMLGIGHTVWTGLREFAWGLGVGAGESHNHINEMVQDARDAW